MKLGRVLLSLQKKLLYDLTSGQQQKYKVTSPENLGWNSSSLSPGLIISDKWNSMPNPARTWFLNVFIVFDSESSWAHILRIALNAWEAIVKIKAWPVLRRLFQEAEISLIYYFFLFCKIHNLSTFSSFNAFIYIFNEYKIDSIYCIIFVSQEYCSATKSCGKYNFCGR